MNWTTARGWGYFLALGIGMAAVAAGWATFDPQTGMIDIAPFNLFTGVALALSVAGSPLMALLAVIKGWGRK